MRIIRILVLTVSRLNITVPDALYERLDRLRDRINASKVCAQALEKELNMLEARPNVVDPDIQELISRLQSVAERWRQRGYGDGRSWAVHATTRQELQSAIADRNAAGDEHIDEFAWPSSFDARMALQQHLLADMGFDTTEDVETRTPVFDKATGRMRFQVTMGKRPKDDALVAQYVAEHRDELERVRRVVDDAAYIRGWMEGASDVWDAVVVALR